MRRSAAKNLGFLLLWRGDHQQGWHWHSQFLKVKASRRTNGAAIPQWQDLTVWNDVGMGDAFQFVRYTFPLIERGEHVRFAVAESQVPLFRNHLAWPLTEVVDRKACSPSEEEHTFL